MKNKFLILLVAVLAAMMCLQVLPLPARAATYGDLTYSVSSEKVTITDCATTASGRLVIPDTIEGYPVTSIGYNAFSSCKDLTEIVIPQSVTYIGSWAFSSSGLTSIVIPEGVTQIGENAFHSCGKLVDVTIPSTLTYIGGSAFNYCDGIENVYISDLKSWCQINFYSTWSNPLTPAEHLYLDGELLSGEVTIPDGTTSIGKCVFNTGDITRIHVPDSVTKIDEYGFYGCSSLQWIDLPNSVTTIDSSTFSGCTSLSHISFPDSVTTIEDRAINNSGVVTVHLGKNVKSIWNSAFQGASNLTSFTVSEENPNFSVSDGILFSKDGTKLIFYPPNKEGTSYTVPCHVVEVSGYAFAYSRYLESVTLPDSVTTLGDSAFTQCTELKNVTLSPCMTELQGYLFSGCSALTTVDIPESVTRLDSYAFYNWTGLKSITIPDGITYLPSNLFEYCSSLESVEIPDSVTAIDQYAFRRCTSLKEITLPKRLDSMDSYVFYYCDNLENIYFTGDAPASMNNYALSTVKANAYYPYSASGWDTASAKQYGGTITWQGYSPAGITASGTCGTGVNWVLDKEGCLAIYGSGAMTNYSTSSGTTTAPWRTYAADITSIVVCKDITSIGNYAFAGCANAETLDIQGNNVSVGRNIIYGCAAMDQVEFTGKIPTLNSAAFTGCSATIRYPANDKTWMPLTEGSYGGNMIWKPRGQTEEYIATGSTSQQIWTLYYDGTIKFSGVFGMPAYSGGTAPWSNYRHHIKTVDIGTLSNISSYAFSDCQNLTSIIWPVSWNSSSGFTGIGERAFYNCDGLTYLFLPPTEAVSVGKYAFYDCDNLKWAAFSAKTSIGSRAFSSCDSLKTLYINDNYPHSRLSIAADGFSGVTADVCYPVGSSIDSYGQTNYGGTLTWKATYYGPCNETVNWEFDETTGTLTISGTGSISNKYTDGNFTPWSCFQDDMKQIVVEEGIDYLPNYCFELCDHVTTISLPNTLKTLSISAFNNCRALNNLILPDSITEFDADRSQFNRCNSLTDLYFFGTKEEWDAIPNSDKVRISADSGITMTIHFLVKQGSEPTCTEPGMKPHYRFDDTSVHSGYYDLEKAEISKPAELPALGHDKISHAAKEPTCGEIGWDAYVTCSRCHYTTYAEKEALDHDIVQYNEKASTCSEAGWDAYEACTRCNYTTYKARPLAEHKPGNPVSSGFVPSTCTQKGSYVSTVYCSNCTEELSSEVIPVDEIPHSPNQAVEENRVEATCTEVGSYDAVTYCDTCGGELERVQIELPLKEHVRGEAKEETRVESTCTEAGYYELIVRCTGCEQVMDTTRHSLPLADHTPGAAVVENRMESTCTQKGSYDLVVYCTQCSAELKRGSKELPLTDHTPGEAVEENRTPSTCLVHGSYDAVIYCTKCHEELSRTTVTLPRVDHTYVEGICSVCGWIEGLEYEIRDGEAVITGFTGPATSFDLPGTIEGCPVTTIDRQALAYKDHLTYVGIPENVTTIGVDAFRGCPNLERISIPSTLKTIESGAFELTYNITRIDIADLSAWCEIEQGSGGGSPLIGGNAYLYLDGKPVRGNITIPEGTERIGSYAFYEYPLITGVTIPEGAASIGTMAFYGCDMLQSVVIPDSVQQIDSYAFYQCYAMSEVEMGSGVKSIGERAFAGCRQMKTISLPDGLTSIGRTAFGGCWDLQQIRIPAGVSRIEDYTFNGCEKLEEVIIEGNVDIIGEGAFYQCYELKEINLPDSITTIRMYAFGGCAFEELELPDNLTTIGVEAFIHCDNLSEIRIPEGVTSIGRAAFYGCDALKTVVIPADLLVMGQEAFAFTEIWDIYFGGTEAEWSFFGSLAPEAEFIHYQSSEPDGHWNSQSVASTCTQAGYTYDGCDCGYERNKQALPLADHTPGAAVVENRVESTCTQKGSYDLVVYCTQCSAELKRGSKELPLADHTPCEAVEENRVDPTCIANGHCDSVVYCAVCTEELSRTTVTLPRVDHTYVEGICSVCGWIEGLEYEIRDGEAVITGFTGPAKAFDLPGTIEGCPVTTIDRQALAYKDHLTYVGIPENVTDIEFEAFRGCPNLTRISIPSTLKTIVTGAFKLTDNITRIDITDLGAWCEIEQQGYDGGSPLSGGNAYLYLDGKPVRGHVTIPEGTTKIGSNAFYEYSLITGVTIPEGVTSIGSAAFVGCENLQRVSLPDSVQKIDDSAFYRCLTLSEIELGSGVREIGPGAFESCRNLKSVSLPDTVTSIGPNAFFDCQKLTEIHIPAGVKSISDYTFQGCSNLKKVTMAGEVTSIGQAAFAHMHALTDIDLPDSVTTIKENAFMYCFTLEHIDLPENLTTIGAYAFRNCSSLTEVRIPDRVETIGAGAFLECSGLKTVVIPYDVLVIGSDAFAGTHLKDIYYGGSKADWTIFGSFAPSAEFIHYQCTEPEGHWYSDGASATCTEAGYSFDTCACGYEKNRQEIPKLAHTEVTDQAVAATCTTDGKTEGKHCSVCGTVIKAQETVKAAGHKEVTDKAVAATCTADGKTEGKHCSVCGTVTKAQETMKAAGHKEVTDQAVAATCTADGKTEGKHCSVCGTVTKAQETVKAAGHKEVTDQAVAATCTADGKTEGKHCSVCGTVTKAQEIVKATGHKEVTDKAVAATCTADGKTEGKHCSVCGTVTKAQETVKAAGHKEVTDQAVAATCTTDGKTEGKHCSVCGTVTKAQEIVKATGHKEVTDKAVAATCTADGKTEGKHCSVCGAVTKTQETVKAAGHSFAEGKCVTCGAEDPNYVKPTEPEVTEPKPTEPEVTEPKPETDGVTRVFGADRYATAFKAADTLKKELGVQKFQNVIVASGTGFADALAGSYLAAQKNAPILLVRGANVNDVKNYIKANLASGGTVYLLGGVNAVPEAMETGLDGFKVKRLGGADRYTTNLLILQEAGVGNKDIIVCTGLNFADSLSASATGLPILLVKGGLTDTQKAFLKGTSGKKIIVGGTSAVSVAVENQLKTYGSVKRLAGNTRYDTSVLVAKEFFQNPTAAVLAYAKNFPDGLSGGPLAYTLNAPLILTDNSKPAAAVTYATGAGIKSGYALGGTGLISDKVVNNIFSMTAADTITVK